MWLPKQARQLIGSGSKGLGWAATEPLREQLGSTMRRMGTALGIADCAQIIRPALDARDHATPAWALAAMP